VTGLSRAQATRLIAQYVASGTVAEPARPWKALHGLLHPG
jgi:hypothetical protein